MAREVIGQKRGAIKMEELRQDLFETDREANEAPNSDERVIAPGETADDRDADEPEFVVDSEFSSTNTNYGGADPAL